MTSSTGLYMKLRKRVSIHRSALSWKLFLLSCRQANQHWKGNPMFTRNVAGLRSRYFWLLLVIRVQCYCSDVFFVNNMGLSSSYVAKRPKLLSYSLVRRIIPWCSVLEVLVTKGLIKDRHGVHARIAINEDKFLRKYVTCYQLEHDLHTISP
ncbi:hypothetical protein SLE2022_252720 [Rubroshorea leprosula]